MRMNLLIVSAFVVFSIPSPMFRTPPACVCWGGGKKGAARKQGERPWTAWRPSWGTGRRLWACPWSRRPKSWSRGTRRWLKQRSKKNGFIHRLLILRTYWKTLLRHHVNLLSHQQVVTKTFHGAGIVVPVDKNDVGYRELPETDGELVHCVCVCVCSNTLFRFKDLKVCLIPGLTSWAITWYLLLSLVVSMFSRTQEDPQGDRWGPEWRRARQGLWTSPGDGHVCSVRQRRVWLRHGIRTRDGPLLFRIPCESQVGA